MTDDHVASLFSEAFDEEMSGTEVERFRSHLSRCATCSDAYERFRERVGALRELPVATMPVAVHLPAGAPGKRPGVVRDRLAGAFRRQPILRLGGAVAGVAAVALIAGAMLRGTGTPERPTPSAARGGAATQAEAGHPGSGCPGGPGIPAAAGAMPTGSAAAVEAAVATLPNRASATAPGGPVLTVATTATRFAAGATVPVLAEVSIPARASAAAGGFRAPASFAVSPCLVLSAAPGAPGGAGPLTIGGVAVPTAGGLQRDSAAGDASIPAPARSGVASLPSASPSPPLPAGAVPVQRIVIPPGTPPGTVLHLVALIPGGYPHAGDPPLTVQLTITVG